MDASTRVAPSGVRTVQGSQQRVGRVELPEDRSGW